MNVLLEYIDLWLAKHYILCLMLPATYYAQKYAIRIGRFLPMMVDKYRYRVYKEFVYWLQKDANILKISKLMIQFPKYPTFLHSRSHLSQYV